MIDTETIKRQLKHTLDKTDFKIGEKYQGKVRDNYTLGDKRIIVASDRISAFDRVLCTIPFKGQILNQTAAFWFEKTRHIVENHVLEVPDPNVLVAKECELIPVEMVIRGYLTGTTKTSAWYNYKNGVRDFCGNKLPEGLRKDHPFSKPIITPTTKGVLGTHDESISKQQILDQKLVDKRIYEQMETATFALYDFGNKLVAKNNLILVDTKYEFGLLDGKLILIDEIHTPDSSRFWIKETYKKKVDLGEEPDKLDKEYVRKFLADKGFLGDGPIPHIPDEVKVEASRRYMTAYEMITGKSFSAEVGEVKQRITNNLGRYLK